MSQVTLFNNKFDPVRSSLDNAAFILLVISMLKFFRLVSMLEGFSYLAILSVTLGFISRDFVSSLGMLHGVLFMVYLVVSLITSNRQQWSIVTYLALFIASLVPFAFIAVELFLSRQVAPKKTVNA